MNKIAQLLFRVAAGLMFLAMLIRGISLVTDWQRQAWSDVRRDLLAMALAGGMGLALYMLSRRSKEDRPAGD